MSAWATGRCGHATRISTVSHHTVLSVACLPSYHRSSFDPNPDIYNCTYRRENSARAIVPARHWINIRYRHNLQRENPTIWHAGREYHIYSASVVRETMMNPATSPSPETSSDQTMLDVQPSSSMYPAGSGQSFSSQSRPRGSSGGVPNRRRKVPDSITPNACTNCKQARAKVCSLNANGRHLACPMVVNAKESYTVRWCSARLPTLCSSREQRTMSL